MENVDKVFYTAGDVVTIKHPLPNKPIMLVKGKETKAIKGADSTHFIGIKCFWFTAIGEYQENVFSTKDLQHVATDPTQHISTTLEYAFGVPTIRF